LDLYPKPATVISEAARRGTYVLAMTTTPKAFEGNLRLVGANKRIRVAAGLHPELVSERHLEVGHLLETMKRTRYVGEVGLDGSPDHRTSLPLQREVLGKVLEACQTQGGKIVSLHSRGAATPVLDELGKVGNFGKAILHWFSGNEDECRRAAAMGCWFSVGPAMLTSNRGRRLAVIMPKDRVLLETDGPFGQCRGNTLMPWDSALALPVLACEFRFNPAGASDFKPAGFPI
jgi:TatD DNase family protein